MAGLLFIAASFATYPLAGLTGFVAALSANLVGLRACREPVRWELGLSGYNAVMLGLGLGYFLNAWWAVPLAVVLGSLSALLTTRLYHLMSRASLPVLGLPFLLICWLVLAVAGRFLPLTGPVHQAFGQLPVRGLPADFLSELGSAYFAWSPLSGILVLAGLLLASRISTALGLLGAGLGVVLARLGQPLSAPLHINLIIAPIGLAFFLAPNRWLWAHVLAGSGLTVAAGKLLEPVFSQLRLPMLILPLTVTLFTFLMLGRAHALGIELMPARLLHSAESNLRIRRSRKDLRLRLPFFGTWFVSQGVNGGITHTGRLAQAWDFMVKDERGRTFVAPGYRLADYHAFGLLVSAPAPGRVVSVENQVRDNPPGKTNKEQNWGNWVVIEHSPLQYSILAHLQQGSIRVRPGQQITAGTVVGACGNSGYSAQPHVHYQLQAGHIPGSDALPVEFSRYLVLKPPALEECLVQAGIPGQDQVIQPLPVQEAIRQLLTAAFKSDFTLVIRSPARQNRGPEHSVRVSESAGRSILRAGRASVMLDWQAEGVAIARLRGPGPALLRLIFEGLDFIPCYTHPGLVWSSASKRRSMGSPGFNHSFCRRERLASNCDALVLESSGPHLRRKLYFAANIGLAKVECQTGTGSTTAVNVASGLPGVS